MGQYYKPICIDTKEYLNAHHYDNGLKLMEHSWIGNNFVCAVEGMLTPKGHWHNKHIVWAGDYMDKNIFIPEEDKKELLKRYFAEIETEDKNVEFSLYDWAEIIGKEIKPA